MITLHETTDDSHGLGGGFSFYIGDVKVPRSFTPATGRAAAERFRALLEPHETALLAMIHEADEKRAWNIASNGHGRAWPIFGRLERFFDNLQSQVDIKDS